MTSHDQENASSGRRPAHRRTTGMIVLTALVVLVVAAVVVVPWWLRSSSPGAGGTPAPSEADPIPSPVEVPDGWRLEQYRGVTFTVPVDWGYQSEPHSAWCAGDPRSWQEQYVALGPPRVLPAIGCPAIPARLVTEHVAVVPADQDFTELPDAPNLHVATRELAGVRLRAFSAEPDLAERIAASLSVEGLRCRPTQATDTTQRPEPAQAVGRIAATGDATVCEYELAPPAGTSTETRPATEPAVLSAAATLPADDVAALTAALSEADHAGYACAATVVGASFDLVITVRVPTADGLRELWLRAGSCGDRAGSALGGFDDGTQVYAVSRDACGVIMREPVRFHAGSGHLGEACAP